MTSIGRAPRTAGQGRPALLVVGAASRDLDSRDPRGWRLGGGVTYGSMVAARLGMHVRALIGADEAAAGADELALLLSTGVEVAIVRLGRGPVFDNRQTATGRLQLVHEVGEKVPVDALPMAWRDSPAVLLAPVCGELSDDWASVPSADALVALGWQGLLRRLRPGQPVERLPLVPRPLLARADLGLVSAEDVVAGGATLAELLPRIGQEVAVTHGERGALHVKRTGAGSGELTVRRVPPVPASRPADPTGAGDSFLAAWCAARAVGRQRGQSADVWRELATGAAAGSAAVEAASLADLPDVRSLCERLLRPPAARDGPPGEGLPGEARPG